VPPADHTEPVTAAYPRGPVRQFIFAHLASRQVARVIYGAIIGLALVVALEAHSPGVGSVIATLLGTAVAVGLAELYSEIIGAETRERRRVDRPALREMGGEALAVVIGAGFPAIFFVLAAAGAFEVDTAFKLSKWSGVVLLCGYAFLGARLAGFTALRSLVHAAAIGLVGGALIALKALLH
jgi:hypothetical protein